MNTIAERKSVLAHVNAFFEQYESEKTRKEYKRDISEYFSYMRGKKIEELTIEDIENNKDNVPLTKSHIINYRTHLIRNAEKKGSENFEGTINRKMSSIKNLYKFLQSEGYNVNHLIFSFKRLTYNPNSYTVATLEQGKSIANYLRDNHKLGKELFPFIIISMSSSLRVSALLSLKWDKIKPVDERFHDFKVREKRKTIIQKPLENWMVEMLLEIKGEDNKVFPSLTLDNVHDAITLAAKELGYEGRITTHSLRKTAPTYEMNTTGNIDMGMKQTGHKNVQVFRDAYVDPTIHYSSLAGIRMFQTVDESVFDLVTKEELIKMLRELNPAAYEQMAFKISNS